MLSKSFVGAIVLKQTKYLTHSNRHPYFVSKLSALQTFLFMPQNISAQQEL